MKRRKVSPAQIKTSQMFGESEHQWNAPPAAVPKTKLVKQKKPMPALRRYGDCEKTAIMQRVQNGVWPAWYLVLVDDEPAKHLEALIPRATLIYRSWRAETYRVIEHDLTFESLEDHVTKTPAGWNPFGSVPKAELPQATRKPATVTSIGTLDSMDGKALGRTA